MQSLSFNLFKVPACNQVSQKQTSAPSFRGAIGDKVVTQIVKGEKVLVNDIMATLKEGSEISAKKAKDLIESLVGKLSELTENKLTKEEQVLNTVIERYNNVWRGPNVISKAFIPKNNKNVVVVYSKEQIPYVKGRYIVTSRVYDKNDFVRPDCVDTVEPLSLRYGERRGNDNYIVRLRNKDGQQKTSEFMIEENVGEKAYKKKRLSIGGDTYTCIMDMNGNVRSERGRVSGESFNRWCRNDGVVKSENFEEAKQKFFEHLSS